MQQKNHTLADVLAVVGYLQENNLVPRMGRFHQKLPAAKLQHYSGEIPQGSYWGNRLEEPLLTNVLWIGYSQHSIFLALLIKCRR